MAFVRAVRRALAAGAALVVATVQTGGARSETRRAGAWPAAEAWFAPNLASPDLLRLFTHPQDWPGARGAVDVFQLYAGSVAGGPCPECGPNTLAALRSARAFPRLREWGIDVAVEAPAVKEWSCAPARAAALTERAVTNVRAAGGRVRHLAMDEPLLGGDACRLSVEETATQAARYAALLRQRHPGIAIGDVEPFPRYDARTITRWLDALLARGFRPAFLHLDVDRVRARQEEVDVADGLRAIQAACVARRVPFGVIVWGHPVGDDRDDRAYVRDARAWAAQARAAVPAPDRVIFQSWTEARDGGLRIPRNLPEDAAHTHTRLIVDTLGGGPRRAARAQ